MYKQVVKEGSKWLRLQEKTRKEDIICKQWRIVGKTNRDRVKKKKRSYKKVKDRQLTRMGESRKPCQFMETNQE